MNAKTQTHTLPLEMPVLVGCGSRPDRARPAALEMEIRIKLSPTIGRLLRRLPIVGACVRRWRLPVAAGEWRPHPTTPGVEIQFGAA